jgi:hypothetical protein
MRRASTARHDLAARVEHGEERQRRHVPLPHE